MDFNERYKEEIRNFGRRLKEVRKKKQLSQLDLELRAEISRTEISRIENGQKNIEFFTIVKLAEALNIKIKELFTDDKLES